jgi:hypothetical protein
MIENEDGTINTTKTDDFLSKTIEQWDLGYEIDLEDVSGKTDGELYCHITNGDLNIPEGYELDTTKQISMTRTWEFSIRKKKPKMSTFKYRSYASTLFNLMEEEYDRMMLEGDMDDLVHVMLISIIERYHRENHWPPADTQLVLSDFYERMNQKRL